eukprot:7422389-Pyramimonas_sp.AAC.1
MVDHELRALPGGFGAALWRARDPGERRKESSRCVLATDAWLGAAQTLGPLVERLAARQLPEDGSTA